MHRVTAGLFPALQAQWAEQGHDGQAWHAHLVSANEVILTTNGAHDDSPTEVVRVVQRREPAPAPGADARGAASTATATTNGSTLVCVDIIGW